MIGRHTARSELGVTGDVARIVDPIKPKRDQPDAVVRSRLECGRWPAIGELEQGIRETVHVCRNRVRCGSTPPVPRADCGGQLNQVLIDVHDLDGHLAGQVENVHQMCPREATTCCRCKRKRPCENTKTSGVRLYSSLRKAANALATCFSCRSGACRGLQQKQSSR